MTRLERVGAVVRWVVGVGAATAVVMLFTLEGAPDDVATPTDQEIERLLDEGREVYAQRCATCHGAEGQGGQGPRLAGTVVVNYPDAADEIAVVTDGRNGMPPFGPTLTDAEIAAVVTYTRFGFS